MKFLHDFVLKFIQIMDHGGFSKNFSEVPLGILPEVSEIRHELSPGICPVLSVAVSPGVSLRIPCGVSTEIYSDNTPVVSRGNQPEVYLGFSSGGFFSGFPPEFHREFFP